MLLLLLACAPKTPPSPSVPTVERVPLDGPLNLHGDELARGPSDAGRLLVRFEDLNCPHCAVLHRDLEDLTAVRQVVKHYPLDEACNPHVPGAAYGSCERVKGAFCMQDQGRGWDYLDVAFASPQSGPTEIAQAAGGNLEALERCMLRPGLDPRLKADTAEGARLGVVGVPTLYLREGGRWFQVSDARGLVAELKGE